MPANSNGIVVQHLLFLLTGNLLLPMVLHAVMDLRMLVILRPPAATEPT